MYHVQGNDDKDVTVDLSLETKQTWRTHKKKKNLSIYNCLSSKNVFQKQRWNKHHLRYTKAGRIYY